MTQAEFFKSGMTRYAYRDVTLPHTAGAQQRAIFMRNTGVVKMEMRSRDFILYPRKMYDKKKGYKWNGKAMVKEIVPGVTVSYTPVSKAAWDAKAAEIKKSNPHFAH